MTENSSSYANEVNSQANLSANGQEDLLIPKGQIKTMYTGQEKPQLLGKRISLDAPDLADNNASVSYLDTQISSFGEKMLKMMGADKDNNSRRPAKPVQFNPRPEGMGLGAVPTKEIIEKIKAGQKVDSKDLKSRGFNSKSYLGMEDDEDPDAMHYGDFVTIVEGKYKDLQGVVVNIDAENDNLVTVQLALSENNVTVLKRMIRKTVKTAKKESKPSKVDEEQDDKQEKKKRKLKWVLPSIRLEIVSTSYKGGKYFKSQGTVEDIFDKYTFSFVLDTGEMLEDLDEKMVQTVIPKVGEKVKILKEGEYKGLVGVLLERQKKENKVVVKVDTGKGTEQLILTQDDCSKYRE